jgi:hypothetical protein
MDLEAPGVGYSFPANAGDVRLVDLALILQSEAGRFNSSRRKR